MSETIESSETGENFEPPVPDHQAARALQDDDASDYSLVLNLEGFEGPLDLLLTLARDQKVDLTKISILALAEQYLEFIHSARKLRLEIAADYLVMAAWLAYLKSKLLLPTEDVDEDEPTAAEMAAALQFQLQRIAAMRNAAEILFARCWAAMCSTAARRRASAWSRTRYMRRPCSRCSMPMAPSPGVARPKR